MNYNHPLISCVCITADRPLILPRALSCFLRQDYPNTEFVISYPEDDLLTKAVIDQLESTSIINLVRLTHLRKESMLFTKHNAINAANGDFICFWNGEHWHHMNRIADQYRVLKNSPFVSSLLMHILLFDFNSQQTYRSYYKFWEETLLCEKKLMLEAIYTDLESTDDASVIHFLSSRNVLYRLSECPHLYILIYCKNNRTQASRYHKFISESESMNEINKTVQDVINMSYYLPNNL